MTWIRSGDFEDIIYEKKPGVAKVTINRPEKRNAFRPKTVSEMYQAFLDAREDSKIGVVLLSGAGPHTDGKYAFCSGGDQSVRGDAGYVGDDGVPRLNVLDLQKLIRSMPKVVIALVSGYAIGGGHVLHVVCDLTIAADNAIFGQTGPKVGSFDGGFGSGYLARIVGHKKAVKYRQYNATELDMGLVKSFRSINWRKRVYNGRVVMESSNRCLNLLLTRNAGRQAFDSQITLYYLSEEGSEGKKSFLNHLHSKYPWLP